MKLHYTKIFLFALPLNILVTSYQVYSKNKPSITQHLTPITTSRVLSEGNIQSSSYDKDADIKSVMENFDRQTSQRFEEYEEHMKEKRQKRKEERDKNIQKIIEKDKREKSLAEKVEKGCLRCGCALGGVAASVGLFGGLGIFGSKSAALAAAEITAKNGAMFEATAKGAEEGVQALIKGLGEMGVSTVDFKELETLFTAKNDIVTKISNAIIQKYDPSSCLIPGPGAQKPICPWATRTFHAEQGISGKVSMNDILKNAVETIVTDAQKAAETTVEKAIKDAIEASTLAVDAKYASCQIAIIASVVTIVVIVLVMVIIYLVLRYRRKKKMKKKAQYTKLLNQ
ncbi:rifin [Plasmodium reichenowi]|uniref:Rifin n=1 Tax=Plasmodium reichenowi TaxID=5854 RepID=A0A060RMD8_PLARE|nr:rifin [Plasmodium reichenowi]